MKCIYCNKTADYVRGCETETGSRPVCLTHARMYNKYSHNPEEFEGIMGKVIITPEMKNWIKIR